MSRSTLPSLVARFVLKYLQHFENDQREFCFKTGHGGVSESPYGLQPGGDSTTCSLDFTDCSATPERRVHFDLTLRGRPPPKRLPDPVLDQVLAERAVRAKIAATEAAHAQGRTAAVAITAEDDAILAPIIAQMARDRDKAASRNSEHWGCIEEREEAHSWKHATALGPLPTSSLSLALSSSWEARRQWCKCLVRTSG